MAKKKGSKNERTKSKSKGKRKLLAKAKQNVEEQPKR